jgi:hypothetical protein
MIATISEVYRREAEDLRTATDLVVSYLDGAADELAKGAESLPWVAKLPVDAAGHVVEGLHLPELSQDVLHALTAVGKTLWARPMPVGGVAEPEGGVDQPTVQPEAAPALEIVAPEEGGSGGRSAAAQGESGSALVPAPIGGEEARQRGWGASLVAAAFWHLHNCGRSLIAARTGNTSLTRQREKNTPEIEVFPSPARRDCVPRQS